MVTRSLVSYDVLFSFESEFVAILNGHQIIGELRPKVGLVDEVVLDWMVTRSLVSYDLQMKPNKYYKGLNGHQIIGELRQIT